MFVMRVVRPGTNIIKSKVNDEKMGNSLERRENFTFKYNLSNVYVRIVFYAILYCIE